MGTVTRVFAGWAAGLSLASTLASSAVLAAQASGPISPATQPAAPAARPMGAATQPMGGSGLAGPAPAAGATSTGDVSSVNYRLGTGDKLRVIVFGEQSLSGEFVISDTGEVAFPLIGSVHAAGLTVQQFDDALRTRLSDGYLRDPRVSAEVENYRPFYILGEVQKPGEYPFTTGLTVMNAVATAGGFSYRANTKQITVRHAGADKELQVRLTATTPVGPGDTIVIRERFF